MVGKLDVLFDTLKSKEVLAENIKKLITDRESKVSKRTTSN